MKSEQLSVRLSGQSSGKDGFRIEMVIYESMQDL